MFFIVFCIQFDSFLAKENGSLFLGIHGKIVDVYLTSIIDYINIVNSMSFLKILVSSVKVIVTV